MRTLTPPTLCACLLVLTALHGSAYGHLHPTQAQFMQRDPIGYVDGANMYAVYRTNSLVFLDPTGHRALCTCAGPAPVFPPIGPACGPRQAGQQIAVWGARVWGVGVCAPNPGVPIPVVCLCKAKLSCRVYDEYQCALNIMTGLWGWAPLITNPNDTCP
jgi:hypothetical protein